MMVIYLLKSNFSFKPQTHNCPWWFSDIQAHRNGATVKKKEKKKPGKSLGVVLDGCVLLLFKMKT